MQKASEKHHTFQQTHLMRTLLRKEKDTSYIFKTGSTAMMLSKLKLKSTLKTINAQSKPSKAVTLELSQIAAPHQYQHTQNKNLVPTNDHRKRRRIMNRT